MAFFLIKRFNIVNKHAHRTVPRRKLTCVKCYKSLDGSVERASCNVVKIDSSEILINAQKLVKFEHESVKSLADNALLKEGFQFLVKKLKSRICVFLDGKAFADEQDRLVNIIKDRCGAGINQRQISVDIRQMYSAVELFKVGRKKLFCGGRAFTLDF